MTRSEFRERQRKFQQGMQQALWVLLFTLVVPALLILPGQSSEKGAPFRVSPWVVAGITFFCVGMALCLYLGFRNSKRHLPRCPKCQTALEFTSAMIVMATGRCGVCGVQIIDGDD